MQSDTLIQVHINTEHFYSILPGCLPSISFSLCMCAHLSASVSKCVLSPAVVHQDSASSLMAGVA